MRRHLPSALFCCCSLIALIWIFVRYHDQADKLAQQEAENIRLTYQVKELEKTLAASGLDRSRSHRSQKPAPATNSTTPVGPTRDVNGELQKNLKDPEYARLWRTQQLKDVHRFYGDLSSLRLSSDQMEKLMNILVDRSEMVIDLNVASRTHGLSPEEQREATQRAFNDETNEIKALIGDAGFNQLNYQSSIEAQRFNDMAISAEFNAAGVPLLPDQANALAKAQIDTNGLSGRALVGALTDRLSSSLTAAQLQILTGYFRDRDEFAQYLKSDKEMVPGH